MSSDPVDAGDQNRAAKSLLECVIAAYVEPFKSRGASDERKEGHRC